MIDQAWGQAKPFSITNYVRDTSQLNGIELAELLSADLEWRWRSSENSGLSDKQFISNVELLGDRSHASAEDYLIAFPHLRDDRQAVALLVETEFLARSRWHSPPTVSSFVGRFGAIIPDLQARLIEVLDTIGLLKIRRLDLPQINESIEVRSGVVLGRATDDGIVVPSYEPSPNRLAIAASSDKSSSRQMLQVDRTAYDQVRITNLSQCVVINVSNSIVAPQATHEPTFPS